jgi:hypothetical protein
MKNTVFRRSLAIAALALFCHAGTAFAQYVWLDERGVKQYSDQPPPPSVPAGRILKQRGTAKAHPSAASAAPTQPSTADQNAAFRKRQAERAEKDKKAAEEQQLAADKGKACEKAQNYQRVLTSGVRISQSGKDGERSFLSDEQRAQELEETRRVLASCG